MSVALLLAGSLLLALVLTSLRVVSLGDVLVTFPFGILIILVSLDLLTNLVVKSNVMEVIAVRLGVVSSGRRAVVVALFTAVLFGLSSVLNNITAVVVIMPVLFVLLKAVPLDRPYVTGLFSLLLAISNLAGASTPIGDFPAIVIMKSGLTSFTGYTWRAFPLFFTTGFAILAVHLAIQSPKNAAECSETGVARHVGIRFLQLQYMNVRLDWRLLSKVLPVFVLMFVGWSTLPPDRVPPEFIAVSGLALAALACGLEGSQELSGAYRLGGVWTLASYLLLATLAQASGRLDQAAELLLQLTGDPSVLLLTLMLSTALLTGILSAGPTAAAMMPIVVKVGEQVFPHATDWLAIAFAASICAGSSLFQHSASAGPLLAEKVRLAHLTDDAGQQITWGWGAYASYGIAHFAVQMLIAILWVFVAMDLI